MSSDIDVLKLEMRPFVKRSVTTGAGNVAGTTLVDAGLTEPDDYWNGMCILIRTAGATVDCSGQLRRVLDWDLASNTLTVNVPFTDPAHPADPKIEAGIQYVMSFPYSDPEVVAIEAKLDDPAHGLVKIKDEIIDVEAKLDDKIVGLASIKFEVAALEEKLDHPTHGLATIKSEIAAIEDKLDHETYGLANIKAEIIVVDTEIAAIEAKLDHETHGLANIKAEIVAIEAKLDHETNGLASIKSEIVAIEAKLDHETNGLASIKTEIIAIEAKLDHETYGLAEIKSEVTSIETKVDAIKAKTDILPAANTDEQDSFLWDTSAYTTVEQDISALFSTPLTGTTRRKYSLFLDLTEAEADGAAWTKCTLKVKVKIDGANYRTVDKKELAKTDVAAGEEPGVNIDIPAVAKDVQVTMQFDVALAGDATIYYHYVKEALE